MQVTGSVLVDFLVVVTTAVVIVAAVGISVTSSVGLPVASVSSGIGIPVTTVVVIILGSTTTIASGTPWRLIAVMALVAFVVVIIAITSFQQRAPISSARATGPAAACGDTGLVAQDIDPHFSCSKVVDCLLYLGGIG